MTTQGQQAGRARDVHQVLTIGILPLFIRFGSTCRPTCSASGRRPEADQNAATRWITQNIATLPMA